HNYAVLFDQDNKKVQLYVDEILKGTVDLTTFNGGSYANFTNGAVGVGAGLSGDNRTWTDNFQVGAPVPVPEPSGVALVAAVAGVLGRRRARRGGDGGGWGSSGPPP